MHHFLACWLRCIIHSIFPPCKVTFLLQKLLYLSHFLKIYILRTPPLFFHACCRYIMCTSPSPPFSMSAEDVSFTHHPSSVTAEDVSFTHHPSSVPAEDSSFPSFGEELIEEDESVFCKLAPLFYINICEIDGVFLLPSCNSLRFRSYSHSPLIW